MAPIVIGFQWDKPAGGQFVVLCLRGLVNEEPRELLRGQIDPLIVQAFSVDRQLALRDIDRLSRHAGNSFDTERGGVIGVRDDGDHLSRRKLVVVSSCYAEYQVTGVNMRVVKD